MAATRFDEKLAEARYFLSRMQSEISSTDLFAVTADLRAAIGAARSVILYAEEDAFEVANGRRSAGPGQLSKDPTVKRLREIGNRMPLLQFFQGLRNSDVHVSPSGSLNKVAHTLRAVAVSAGSTSDPKVFTLYTLTLAEWPEPGPDAFSLCEQYLAQIETFLADAAAQGLIRR